MSWASLWRPPIQIRPVSHQAGPKINDKRGKDKWERLTISCKVLHMNCLSKYPEDQKQRHMFSNSRGWPLFQKKNKKFTRITLFFIATVKPQTFCCVYEISESYQSSSVGLETVVMRWPRSAPMALGPALLAAVVMWPKVMNSGPPIWDF